MSDKVQIPLMEVAALLTRGYSLAELKGIDKQHLDALYALAYQHYNADNYQDASNIFKVLCLCEPANEDYAFGLASCEQGLKHYDQAAELYAMACTISGLTDPKPMYFAAICLLKQGKQEGALAALESIEVMGREGETEDVLYKTKATELLKVLKQGKEVSDGR